jgi:hypothetical protein
LEQEIVVKYYNLESFGQAVWKQSTVDVASIARSMSAGALLEDHHPQQKSLSKAKQQQIIVDMDTADDMRDPLQINDSFFREMRVKNPRPQLLISSKAFDPTYYLVTVQVDASYKDLEAGTEKLKQSIQQRTQVMKNLVKTHFAKFVSAKTTIDCTLFMCTSNFSLLSRDAQQEFDL